MKLVLLFVMAWLVVLLSSSSVFSQDETPEELFEHAIGNDGRILSFARLRKAAEMDHPLAQIYLFVHFSDEARFDGAVGQVRRWFYDGPEQAVFWRHKALASLARRIEAGDIDAMLLFSSGWFEDFDPDSILAGYYLRKAAALEEPNARYRLALRLKEREQNEEARLLFEGILAGETAEARLIAATMFRQGIGVDQNIARHMKLLFEAMEHGSEQARHLFERRYQQLLEQAEQGNEESIEVLTALRHLI
jgi:TPR repeat protein